jgi:hypothetical protein
MNSTDYNISLKIMSSPSVTASWTPPTDLASWIDFVIFFIQRFFGWLFDPYMTITEKYDYAEAFYNENNVMVNWALSYGFGVLAISTSIQTIAMYAMFGKVFLDFGHNNIKEDEPTLEIDPNTGLPIEPPVQETDPSEEVKEKKEDNRL